MGAGVSPLGLNCGCRGGFSITEDIFRKTSPAFSCQLDFWVRCRARWVTVVCRGIISVVVSKFSMAIVLSWIAFVFIDGMLASAKLVSTGTKVASDGSSCVAPVISLDSPTLSSISTAATYSTFERPVSM